MQRVHCQVRVGVFSCQDKYLFRYLWYCGKKTYRMWFRWSVLLSTTIRVITCYYSSICCCATNWATSQSARFTLVIEYVSSIHPWANSRCWISQSERALCFSYVVIIFFTNKFFNHIWVAVCRVSEVAPSISPLTFFLILYSYLFETLTCTTFHFTRWSRDCPSVEWEPISLGFHVSAPKEATNVGSETTDEYT